MKKRVLIVQPIHQSGVDILKDKFEVRVASDPSVPTLIREISGVHGAIVRTAPFPRDVIEKADSLMVIARHGVGVDNIDVDAATKRGIPVVNTPNANALSVAEATVLYILALAKRLFDADKATREGRFEWRNNYEAIDIEGKTIGLVGAGRVGSLVAKKCVAAFGMRVLIYDPYISDKNLGLPGARLCESLDEVLREADFVSLHVPLTPETRGLIGERELSLMKPTAFLINAARGGVADEKALIGALKTKRIAGAALDVFALEPPEPDNPLLTLDNVILTPHMAALTKECVVRMATGAAKGVLDVLEGRRPEAVVNPEVFRAG